jgi:outer membrane protein OmpA-like peptidoglycan-associated protein/opacity protein-like surface antigen
MRGFIGVLLLMLLFTSTVFAEDLNDRWGAGFQLGNMKLVGGEVDHSNIDQFGGFWLRRGFSPHWSLDFTFRSGYVRPGVPSPGEAAGFTFQSTHAYYTTMNHGSLGARYHFNPESSWNPYAGFHVGYLSWKVRDENGNSDVAFFPDGPTVIGYDNEGNLEALDSANVTLALSLGMEYFLSKSVSLDLGARYSYLMDNSLDNIGMSSVWGASSTDANSGLVESYLGLTIYFGGNNDRDDDGILNDADFCPDEAEDFDGFQDEDGCPDPDNDGDGIIDARDQCPDEAEDMDGFQDEDGCPDPDNDGDGIIDARDQCPDEAEDMDGFQDEDGCPEFDNDGDGVVDANDKCPDTPTGVMVGLDGCPEVAVIQQEMVLSGVNFKHSKAILTTKAKLALDEVAESLLAYPAIKVEIQGYTDSRGSYELNRQLSQDRANAVRSYLISKGVASSQMQAIGYGEDHPVGDNNTHSGRVANRRVELKRIN